MYYIIPQPQPPIRIGESEKHVGFCSYLHLSDVVRFKITKTPFPAASHAIMLSVGTNTGEHHMNMCERIWAFESGMTCVRAMCVVCVSCASVLCVCVFLLLQFWRADPALYVHTV